MDPSDLTLLPAEKLYWLKIARAENRGSNQEKCYSSPCYGRTCSRPANHDLPHVSGLEMKLFPHGIIVWW